MNWVDLIETAEALSSGAHEVLWFKGDKLIRRKVYRHAWAAVQRVETDYSLVDTAMVMLDRWGRARVLREADGQLLWP